MQDMPICENCKVVRSTKTLEVVEINKQVDCEEEKCDLLHNLQKKQSTIYWGK